MMQPTSTRVVTGVQSLELFGSDMSGSFGFDADSPAQRVARELESYASAAGTSVFEQLMREFDESSGLVS